MYIKQILGLIMVSGSCRHQKLAVRALEIGYQGSNGCRAGKRVQIFPDQINHSAAGSLDRRRQGSVHFVRRKESS